MSAEGDVVVGLTPDNQEIWRWSSQTGYELLENPVHPSVEPHSFSPDVSDDGQIVSGSMVPSGDDSLAPAVWTAESGWHTAADLARDSTGKVLAGNSSRGLSGNGKVLVGVISEVGAATDGLSIAAWGRGTFYAGSDVQLPQSSANDANFDGSLIVGWRGESAMDTHQPTVWDEYGATPLAPVGVWGEALATSPDGHIVVGRAYDKKTHHTAAALWLRSDYGWVQEILGTLPGTVAGMGQATALDLSGDGTVIVGRNQFDGRRAAGFVWTPGLGLMDVHDYLDLLGVKVPTDFMIDAVTCVSNDGTILVGVGKNERVWPPQNQSFQVRCDQVAAQEQRREKPAQAGLGALNPFEER